MGQPRVIPAPFEVVPHDNGFAWRLIGACGRALVYSIETYPCMFSAARDAKAARVRYSEMARAVDG